MAKSRTSWLSGWWVAALVIAAGGCGAMLAAGVSDDSQRQDTRPTPISELLSPTELAEAEYSAFLIQRGVDFDAVGGREVLISRGRELCSALADPGASLITEAAKLMDRYQLSRTEINAISGGAMMALCPERSPLNR